MFSVRHIVKNCHYIVYSVNYDNGTTKFLIYDAKCWKWEPPHLFEPTNYNIN